MRRRCLMARRLVERGVRYVQLYINAQIWDNHSQSEEMRKTACERTDKPVGGSAQGSQAARACWTEPWSSGAANSARMPIAQFDKNAKDAGRDHNPRAFTLWMAGAGIKPGITYGATDESATKPSKIRSALPTGTPPSCICWVWTISNWCSIKTG